MVPFNRITGLVAPLDRANVDTDAIIPKQFLKSIRRTGFGVNLFDEWRYQDQGEPDQDCRQRPLNPDFILNQPRYRHATILLTRHNFGCGSSREHAPWALVDYGFRVLLAPSFADIFYQNAIKNGLLPICLDDAVIEQLFQAATAPDPLQLTVDLQDCVISPVADATIQFTIDPFHRHCLLNGLDDIALTLQHEAAITAYEQKQRAQTPWLFMDQPAT
jgi:3-isopropylmalate/(R)-2-methylmalate dehydratase small subunit